MSIYDSIGGPAAVRAAVDDFYARVLADPKLAPFFTGTDPHRLKARQRSFIAAATGKFLLTSLVTLTGSRCCPGGRCRRPAATGGWTRRAALTTPWSAAATW